MVCMSDPAHALLMAAHALEFTYHPCYLGVECNLCPSQSIPVKSARLDKQQSWVTGLPDDDISILMNACVG